MDVPGEADSSRETSLFPTSTPRDLSTDTADRACLSATPTGSLPQRLKTETGVARASFAPLLDPSCIASTRLQGLTLAVALPPPFG